MRRSLPRNDTFRCGAVGVGGSVISYKEIGRKSASARRGPPMVLDTDDTGGAAKFQGQTFKVARFFVQKLMAGRREAGKKLTYGDLVAPGRT